MRRGTESNIQLVQSHFIAGAADPRFKKYERIVTADDNGNFAFHQVPAGRYFVLGEVDRYDAEFDSYEIQWGLERITLGRGESRHVAVSHNPNRAADRIKGIGTLR